jgi:hypothetical protein
MTRITAQVSASRHADYDIHLSIVDRPVCNHAHCVLCQDIGSVVEAEVYLPVEAGDGHLAKRHVECCCTCVFSAIDGEPHLAIDQVIQVEIYRGATLRAV